MRVLCTVGKQRSVCETDLLTFLFSYYLCQRGYVSRCFFGWLFCLLAGWNFWKGNKIYFRIDSDPCAWDSKIASKITAVVTVGTWWMQITLEKSSHEACDLELWSWPVWCQVNSRAIVPVKRRFESYQDTGDTRTRITDCFNWTTKLVDKKRLSVTEDRATKMACEVVVLLRQCHTWGDSDVISPCHIYVSCFHHIYESCFPAMMWGKLWETFVIVCDVTFLVR